MFINIGLINKKDSFTLAISIMEEEKQLNIFKAIEAVYPYELFDRQKRYLIWLIDNAQAIGGFDIGKLVCDYLKIDNKESRKKIKKMISEILINE